MATVKVSSQIAAPVERVFQMFTDIEHGAEHVSGIKKIETLTTGPFSLVRAGRRLATCWGRLDDAEMEVTAFELNRTYTVTHRKAGTRIDATFTFEPLDGETSVSIEFSSLLTGRRLDCCRRWSGRCRARSVMCSAAIWPI